MRRTCKIKEVLIKKPLHRREARAHYIMEVMDSLIHAPYPLELYPGDICFWRYALNMSEKE